MPQSDNTAHLDPPQNLDYITHLFEQIRDQKQEVLETVGDMQAHVQRIPVIEEKVDTLVMDMQTVKKAVKDTNHDLHVLTTRVDRLETTVYQTP